MWFVAHPLPAFVASVPEDARAYGRSKPGTASERAAGARTVPR